MRSTSPMRRQVEAAMSSPIKNEHFTYWNCNGEFRVKQDIGEIGRDYGIMFKLVDKPRGGSEKHVPFITMGEMFMSHSVIGTEIKAMKRQMTELMSDVNVLKKDMLEDLTSMTNVLKLEDLTATVEVLKEQTDFLMIESKKAEDKARLEKRLNDLRTEAQEIECQLKHL